VSDNPRENDFERESSRLHEGLRSCRAVVNNYRAMMSGDQAREGDDGSDISNYVSTTTAASDGYEGESSVN
jgi:hypothetical protein